MSKFLKMLQSFFWRKKEKSEQLRKERAIGVETEKHKDGFKKMRERERESLIKIKQN